MSLKLRVVSEELVSIRYFNIKHWSYFGYINALLTGRCCFYNCEII